MLDGQTYFLHLDSYLAEVDKHRTGKLGKITSETQEKEEELKLFCEIASHVRQKHYLTIAEKEILFTDRIMFWKSSKYKDLQREC